MVEWIILLVLIASLVWLVRHKKWKALIFTLSVAIVIGLGVYAYLRLLGQAFREECSTLQVWKIDGYTIVRKKCLGPYGPHHYPVVLFKDGDVVAKNHQSVTDTSCMLWFHPRGADSLRFDICKINRVDSTDRRP